MDFYLSWYPGDLWVPNYDPDCRMLISASSVSQFWRLSSYDRLPSKLIIDSGGFRYANRPRERPLPREILSKQLSMVAGRRLKIYLCALDYPILDPNLSSNEKDACITQTIAFAYEMKKHLELVGLGPEIEPMAIVQGYDIDSLRFCAQELKAIGYSRYALGSLLAVRQQESVLLERVQAVIDEVGRNLHIFGISNVATVRRLRSLGVASFDSARAAKSAMFNQIFFYVNHELRIIQSRGRRNTRIPVPSYLQDYHCSCPICEGRLSDAITLIGKRQNIALRAIHNYWHLRLAFLD
jgi:tRNA-guanine family transglycosylase